MAEKAAMKRFGNAALDAEKDAGLSRKAADTTIRVASLSPKVATGDPLWLLPSELSLWQCVTRRVPTFMRTLWQDAEHAVSQKRRPVQPLAEL